MDPVVVVGGGISGVACARALTEGGVDVGLLDQGRRLGGRMAVRTVDGHAVDTGASYFTVSDDRFAAVVADWQARGLAREWTDTFEVYDDGERGDSKQGSMRWASPSGLRSLVEDLAAGLRTEQVTVQAVTRDEQTGALAVDGRPAGTVVLAMPDPQARRLLDPSLHSRSVLTDDYAPTLALLVEWERRSWHQGFDGAFVNGDPHLTWIADDGARRGDGAPVLVAHATEDLARQHLADPDAAEPVMLASLTGLLDIRDRPTWSRVQRWSFAHPAGTREDAFHLGDDGIGFCGDSWSDKPRVEAAWLSGTQLADAILDRRR
ncbi:NAD(P)/FAD-dependent oxidoreductase [Allobranchiibius sp. GilTou73]|uniref:NAD(P)/FAD-dependent oxidoreductase n=1 Tax=Allobranchiibius sp. GilTou73 TaxID=2904523 RepID=UPI001F271BF3|nr:FAD-dependent oxidoreductase [Allobranchiibius sp. GilTou73]UIJ35302.1 NAD(P)-binding protein [Allobranchiibius sp. GilTou73]